MCIKPWAIFLVLLYNSSFAQGIEKLINEREVARIETILSSDEMQGRNVNSPGINKAADFIVSEFKAIGLQTWNGSNSYKQEFTMVTPTLTGASGSLNKGPLSAKDIMVITSLPVLRITQDSGFETAIIRKGSNLFVEANRYIQSDKNYVVLVDTSFGKYFNRLAFFRQQLFKSDKSVVFVLAAVIPEEFEISATHDLAIINLANIIGVLPGTSAKKEYVIFSGHYDHLGIGKPVGGDSIFNGANDDAAGITAVIMLAKYFKAIGENERTLVFAAFTSEETGGFGSQYFSKQFDPSSVIAMFNIEMIGTESKWGKNSAYITGYEKTDMGKLLAGNLKGTRFKFYPDPYPDQQLFYRSDNATLARLGVPAHTISTSKMDNEKFYHTVDDEIETLDMKNMTNIIKAIALSSKTIVGGKQAPSRVDTKQLE